MTETLKILLPKQKRLKEAFAPILDRAGYGFEKGSKRQAFGVINDTQQSAEVMEASERKPDDAMRKLVAGKGDMAVIGLDKYIEKQAKAYYDQGGGELPVGVVAKFNCAACSMYIAARPDQNIQQAKDLEGLRIATSFPNSLKYWMEQQGITDFEIIECDGDTEDELRDDSADAIFEIVDSGQSLVDNGLETKIFAYDIQAVLVARNDLALGAKAGLSSEVIGRLKAASEPINVAPAVVNIQGQRKVVCA